MSRTAWQDEYRWPTSKPSRPPIFRFHKSSKVTLIFDCPFCFKKRKITGDNHLICGSVQCGCSKIFQITRDDIACSVCLFKMKCLSVGIVTPKKEIYIPDLNPYSHLTFDEDGYYNEI